MDITAAIDIAIGLVLMYLVLSLFCTTINEFIASVLSLRAKSLAKALTELLDDPALKTAFDGHGLITSSATAASGGKPAGKPPSYLSSRNVALAVIDFLGNSTANFATIQAKVAALQPSKIKTVLQAGLLEAQGNFDKFRDGIATWFDGAMDRLSGAYKRDLQVISLIIGIAVAAAFNADTLWVGRTLWQDRSLSATIAQATPQLMTKICATADACAGKTPASVDVAANAIGTNLKAVEDNLHSFPLGWSKAQLPAVDTAAFWLKLLGLLLTGVALSMGAPFWFDTLQRIMNFRNAGDEPPKAKTP